MDNMGGYGIEDFVEKEVGFNIESEVSKDELYQRYVEFCKREGKFCAERAVFFREFYRLCGDRIKAVRRGVGGKRVWKILGIYLK